MSKHERITNYLFERGHTISKPMVDDVLALITQARIDELKQMWNNTQHDIKPEGADDTPIDPAYITDRLTQLKGDSDG